MSIEWSVPAPRCRRPTVPVVVVAWSRHPVTKAPVRLLQWCQPPEKIEQVLHRPVRSEQGQWFDSLRELIADLRSENSTATRIPLPVHEVLWRPFDPREVFCGPW